MGLQFDITLKYKGEATQYLDWTDFDNISALKEFGFAFIPLQEKLGFNTWDPDGLNKSFITVIGDRKTNWEDLREFLNGKIKECGLDNLVIQELYVFGIVVGKGYDIVYEEKGS